MISHRTLKDGSTSGRFEIMPKTTYWADAYVQKACSAENALQHIRPGQRVFIGSSCGEPQHLVNELSKVSERFTDLEIVRLLSIESGPLTLIANRSHSQQFNIRSFLSGICLPHQNQKTGVHHPHQPVPDSPSVQVPAHAPERGPDPGIPTG